MTVISASRRTDLVAFFPEWLATAARVGRARILGPRRVYVADLRPEVVHTIVLWSKDFSNLLRGVSGLDEALARYEQVYALLTITGLGGTVLEPGAPAAAEALAQIPHLAAWLGDPRRLSIRFDPVVFWAEAGRRRSNLDWFERVAAEAARAGVADVRTSFAQWYGKAIRRTTASGLGVVDPEEDEKVEAAAGLQRVAARYGVRLWACSQPFLGRVPGIGLSACIDGRRLAELHPRRAPAAEGKDRSQRPDCGCTVSLDIGSYSQACPHACLYCYANPGRF